MANIFLQKLIEREQENLEISSEWRYRDLKKFGLNWELFPYQQKAMQNITTLLYLLYRDWNEKDKEYEKERKLENSKQNIINLYRNNGLDQELENSLAITGENGNFKFLSDFFSSRHSH